MSFLAYCGLPEVYGRINMRHCNNFYPESLINVLRIYVFKFVMFDYVISGIPRFAGSLQKTPAIIFKLHPESLINVLRIYVFKFVMFIETCSILQNHLPEPVPKQFSPHCELLS